MPPLPQPQPRPRRQLPPLTQPARQSPPRPPSRLLPLRGPATAHTHRRPGKDTPPGPFRADAATGRAGLAKPPRGAQKRPPRLPHHATPSTEHRQLPGARPGHPRAEAWDRSAQARPRTPTTRPVSAKPRPRFFDKTASNCHIFGPKTHQYPSLPPRAAPTSGQQKTPRRPKGKI